MKFLYKFTQKIELITDSENIKYDNIYYSIDNLIDEKYLNFKNNKNIMYKNDTFYLKKGIYEITEKDTNYKTVYLVKISNSLYIEFDYLEIETEINEKRIIKFLK